MKKTERLLSDILDAAASTKGKSARNFSLLLAYQNARLREAVRTRKDMRQAALDILQEIDALWDLLMEIKQNA